MKMVPAFKLLGAGLYMGAVIFGGTAGGYWLDRKLATQPVFVLAGLFLGLLLAFWGFYRMVIPVIKAYSEPKERK